MEKYSWKLLGILSFLLKFRNLSLMLVGLMDWQLDVRFEFRISFLKVKGCLAFSSHVAPAYSVEHSGIFIPQGIKI